MEDQKPLLILGCGGHAKVVADALLASGKRVLGFIAESVKEKGYEVTQGLSVIECEEDLKENSEFSPNKVHLILGVGSIKVDSRRAELFQKFRELGYRFDNLKHPAAVISPDVTLGEGVQIMAGAVIQPGVVLGDGVIVNSSASVDHDCVIEPFVHIAPNATLSGSVKVGAYSHIGVGATVIQKITVGPFTTIGAGSVVLKSIGSHATVVGNPARII